VADRARRPSVRSDSGSSSWFGPVVNSSASPDLAITSSPPGRSWRFQNVASWALLATRPMEGRWLHRTTNPP